MPNEFHFTSPTKPALDFSYHYDPEHDDGSQEAEARAKKNDDMVERRLRELGVVHAKDGRTLRGPFPYPDLTFASKSTRDDATGKVAVWFGAHVDGEAPVYPIRVELGPHPMFDKDEEFAMGDAELVYANVTRDGSEVGVVVVAGGTMWYEAADVARMPVATFVLRVYEETAARHQHTKGR